MNNSAPTGRKVIILGVVGMFIVFIIVIVMAVININDKKKNTVQIDNLDSCSKNMNDAVKKSLFESVFVYVKAANDFNKAPTDQSYSATIRANSCKQVQTSDGKDRFNQTTVIVDVPKAKQSWAASYHWRTTDDTRPEDLGEAAITCVAKDQLIYGDFNCANVPLVKKATLNAILSVLPIIVAEYSKDYSTYTEFKITSPTSKNGVPVIKITDTTGGNKDRALAILKQKGFNPADYTVEYEYVPIVPLDTPPVND